MLDNLRLREDGLPRYRALAAELEARIRDGRLPPGFRLPPQRHLSYDLDVTIGTVGRAYELLVQRGLVRGEVGRGTYVLDPAASVTQLGMFANDSEPAAIDLSTNNPVPTAACEELRQLLTDLLNSDGVDRLLASYPPAAGWLAGRRHAGQWLAHIGVQRPAEQIVISAGAQGGLAASVAATARPGDGLLLESLTYPRFATLARTFGLRPEGVAIDERGMVPEALDAACRQGRGRVVILSSSMNNPTTAMMDEDRRREIASVAERRDLILIEDDVYGPLVPERPAPIAELAPDRTIYIASLSKFLAPGQRLGVIAAPARLIPAISQRHADLTLGAAGLTVELLNSAQSSGLLLRAEKLQRKAIARRQAIVRPILGHGRIESRPEALHVWLALPPGLDTDELCLRLAGDGIRIAASREFATTQDRPQAVRISIGGSIGDDALANVTARIDRALTLPSAGSAI
ncbi:MAG: PLP-dependent aminotransferase family protein [Geminicoccaceae bacterium]